MSGTNRTPRGGRRRPAAAVWIAVALLWPACGSPPPEPVAYFDLIRELPLGRQVSTPAAKQRGEEPAAAQAEGDTLLIPAGRQIHYSLEMPAAARIVFDGVRPQGESKGRLAVSLQPHGGETQVLARIVGSSDRREIEWRAPGPQVVRLTLAAQQRQGGVLVRSPAIWRDGPEGPTSAPRLARREIRRLRKVRRPNVVFYLIDSLRADRLGCYGYDKAVSPAIDAFAARALLFENATANSSWTKSAVASLFTGLWPASHRAITREDKLPDGAFTLAEALHEAGYATAGFSTNPSIADEFGFGQGFDGLELLSHETYAEEVTDRAVEWLREFDGERPFFLYVHTLDPHDPYVPQEEDYARWSPGVDREFAATTAKLLNSLNRKRAWGSEVEETRRDLEALYDGEIAANDRAFGRLLEELEGRGSLEETVVLLVADHGEDFGEHRVWRHGQRLTRESLHVPLVVRLPGDHRIGREPSVVQQVDVLPTLLELLELDVPEWVEGESLLPLFLDAAAPVSADPAFLYVRFSPPTRIGVLWEDWKLVAAADRHGLGGQQLFRVDEDPEERHDLARRFPVMRDFLATMLARKLLDRGAGLTGEQTEIGSETRKALRALGYIQ